MSAKVTHIERPNDLLWGWGPTYCDKPGKTALMSEAPLDATCVRCRRALLLSLESHYFFKSSDRRRQKRWVDRLKRSLRRRG